MIVNKTLNYNSSIYSKDNNSDIKEVDRDLDRIYDCLQGRVRFGSGTDGNSGENIDGEWQIIATTTANTEVSIPHGLGSVPVGYIVVKINVGGVIYDSGTAWTSSRIFIKCSAANATATLFLLH